MKLFGREVRAAYAAAGVAASALLLGVALYPTPQQNADAVADATSHRLLTEDGEGVDGTAGQRVLAGLSEAELDAIYLAEEASAEDVDVNVTENEEIEGLFSAIDEITESISAGASECTESGYDDGDEPEESAGDVDFNATETVVPCGSEDEMEELEFELSETSTELAIMLDDGTVDGEEEGQLVDGITLDSVYTAYEKVHKRGRKDEGDDIPDDLNASSEASRKKALKETIVEMRKHNAAARAAKAEREAQGKAKGHDKTKAKGAAAGDVDESLMGLNKFSDWDEETFESVMFAENENAFAEGAAGLAGTEEDPSPSSGVRRNLNAFTSATSFTWEDSGRLGQVVNQGACGSCYLNAVVTEVETALAIAKNEAPISLSREQIKNCQKENFKHLTSSPRGCNGGWMQYSYEYIRKNWIAGCSSGDNCQISQEGKGGITLASEYPYEARNLKCAYDENAMPKKTIVGLPETRWSSYKYIRPSETNFKAALVNGPIVVALGASGWGGYGSGVKTCGSGQYSINHAVLLVGWGEENGVKYWKIQNSWGTGWGEGGFIKIRRGLNADGSESSSGGKRGDKGCGMTIYGGYQSKYVEKFDPNQQDCQGEWTDWSACTDPCETAGNGQQTRQYKITTAATNGGIQCPYPDDHTETRKCKYTYDESPWTACSKECNGGTQERVKKIMPVTGETCDADVEERACNTHICPDSCLVIKDARYSVLNGNYRPSTGPNHHDWCSGDVPIYTNDNKYKYKLFWYAASCTRGYWMFNKNVGRRFWGMLGGWEYEGTSPLAVRRWWNNRNKIKIEAMDCDQLPQDCEVKWDEDWGACSEECGGGVQQKGYTVMKPQMNGGKACPALREQTCNVHLCGAKCMKVENARYRFLNGVYQTAEEGGWTPSSCGGQEVLPRYTKTVVRKFWWRPPTTYKYDLVYMNSRCRRRNGVYEALGGRWALGRVRKWIRRGKVSTYACKYDRSPKRWWDSIRNGASNHPHVAGWEESAEMTTNNWYRKGATTVTEVACGS